MTLDERIADHAARQYGLITYDQLLSVGLTQRTLHYRVKIGRLERLEPRLYRLAGTAESWEQHVLATCLSAGGSAVAARRTAAIIWGLWDGADRPIEIAVPRPRRPHSSSATLFRSTDLVLGHRTEHERIPVTTVARTLTDLGAVARPWQVENALDVAIVRGLVTTPELDAMIDAVSRQGRRGVGTLRRAMADIVDGVESVLEAKLVRLILRSELPRPELQYRVPLGRDRDARIDIAYPEVKLAIEADGREAHLSREAFDWDRERQAILEAMGWRFLRYTWTHVTQRQTWVVSQIGDVYRQRQAAFPSAS